MACHDSDQGQNRHLDFTNAQGMRFRLCVEDDASDACSFVVRVTPLVDEASAAATPTPGSDDPLCVLTAREREVALLVAECFTNDQVAGRLCISLSTVKSHVQNIFSKMHVTNRTALVALLHDSSHLSR